MSSLLQAINTNKAAIAFHGAAQLSFLPAFQRFSHLNPLIRMFGCKPYAANAQALGVFAVTEGAGMLARTISTLLVEKWPQVFGDPKNKKDQQIAIDFLTIVILGTSTAISLFYLDSNHAKRAFAGFLDKRISQQVLAATTGSFIVALYARLFFNLLYPAIKE